MTRPVATTIAVLIAIGAVSTGIDYLGKTGRLGQRLWQSSARGRRHRLRRLLHELRVGNTVATFTARLGAPDRILPDAEHVHYHWQGSDGLVRADTDEHGTVKSYEVTVATPGFKPEIRLLPKGGHPTLAVTLGKTTLADVETQVGTSPIRLQGGLGASSGSYEETYWFGRVGNYHEFTIGYSSDSAVRFPDELAEPLGDQTPETWPTTAKDIRKLLSSPGWVRARRNTKVSTYRISTQMMPPRGMGIDGV
jgi:hypothetical protein